MHRNITCLLAAALLVFGLDPSLAADQWGNLTGKFVYDGAPPQPKPLDVNKDLECCKVKHKDESLMVGPDGGIANVIVYLRTPKVKVNPEYEATAKDNVDLDNRDCHFVPHVLVMRTTQTLLIKNTDMCSHNTNISVLGGQGINPLIAASQEVPFKFARQSTLPAKVNCNIHPWMSAHVLPRDNPYFAVTGPDGSFEIKDLPAGGELEFQAWQELCGYVDVAPTMPKGKFKKKIQAGANDLGTIKLKPALFKK